VWIHEIPRSRLRNHKDIEAAFLTRCGWSHPAEWHFQQYIHCPRTILLDAIATIAVPGPKVHLLNAILLN
jgi:hypothetical protein